MYTVYFTVFLIFLTIIFIGFFAGLEIAFVTANRLNIELKKKQGKKKWNYIVKIHSKACSVYWNLPHWDQSFFGDLWTAFHQLTTAILVIFWNYQ